MCGWQRIELILNFMPYYHCSCLSIVENDLSEVWKQMLNSSWCGLLAALSLLLEAR